MPSKIYAFADAILGTFSLFGNYTLTQPFPAPDLSVPLSTYVTNPSIGRWEYLINESGITPGIPGPGNTSNIIGSGCIVACGFQLVYNTHIPVDALIRKVTYRLPRSVNLLYGTNITDGGLQQFVVTNPGFTVFNTNIPYVFPGNNYPGLSSQITESFAGSDADIVLFDYGGVEGDRITRAQLIASYSNFNCNANVFSIRSTTSNGTAAVTAIDLIGTISIGNGWTVTIEYDEAFNFNWAISQNTAPFDEGTVVTITSDPDGEEPPLDLDEIETIDIIFPDPDNPGDFITIPVLVWTNITPNLLTFIMPDWDGYTPSWITVSITSTEFSGSAALQMYTIYFASASGIYELVPGKTSDTLYLEDDPGETFDAKIPNPYGKTGFFGK